MMKTTASEEKQPFHSPASCPHGHPTCRISILTSGRFSTGVGWDFCCCSNGCDLRGGWDGYGLVSSLSHQHCRSMCRIAEALICTRVPVINGLNFPRLSQTFHSNNRIITTAMSPCPYRCIHHQTASEVSL